MGAIPQVDPLVTGHIGKEAVMNSRKRQKGEGKAGLIFWILIFVAIGLVAKAWIPAKIADMQFKDHLEEISKIYPRKSSQFFHDRVMERARELDIPLKPKNVTVDKTAARVRYKIRYVKELDFVFTTYMLEFRHNMERDIFIM